MTAARQGRADRAVGDSQPDPDTDHAPLDDWLAATKDDRLPPAAHRIRRMPAHRSGDSVHNDRRPSEFHWETAGPSAAHAHVTQPIVRLLDELQAQRVLDLGCGNGWFAAGLVRCGFDAVGVDVSESGIDLACANHPGVEYRRLDLLQPLTDDLIGQFDAVVAIDLLDHVLLPREALRQAVSALRPGGRVIATIPYHGYLKDVGIALSAGLHGRLDPLRDHGRLRFFSRKTIRALMTESGLMDLRLETIGRIPVIARSMLVTGTAPAG